MIRQGMWSGVLTSTLKSLQAVASLTAALAVAAPLLNCVASFVHISLLCLMSLWILRDDVPQNDKLLPA